VCPRDPWAAVKPKLKKRNITYDLDVLYRNEDLLDGETKVFTQYLFLFSFFLFLYLANVNRVKKTVFSETFFSISEEECTKALQTIVGILCNIGLLLPYWELSAGEILFWVNPPIPSPLAFILSFILYLNLWSSEGLS